LNGFGLVGDSYVAPVAQGLGVFPLVYFEVVLGGEGKLWLEVEAVSGQHQLFLQLVYLVHVEGRLPGFLELLYSIGIFQGVEGVF